MKKVNIGDWVTSYSKGIYRVDKIVTQYYDELDILDEEDKKVGDEYADKLIVSKRLLNASFKKSLGYDSCSDLFIKPLSKQNLKLLKETLNKNPNWLVDLDNYQVPAIRSIYNMDLALKTTKDVKLIKEFISFIEGGRTYKDIKREMVRNSFDKFIPDPFGNYILQLINIDHEQRSKRTVWREAHLLKSG